MKEPSLKIGVMYEPEIVFVLNTPYMLKQNGILFLGKHKVHYAEEKIYLNDEALAVCTLEFEPVSTDG